MSPRIKIIMLTGDNLAHRGSVAQSLGIDHLEAASSRRKSERDFAPKSGRRDGGDGIMTRLRLPRPRQSSWNRIDVMAAPTAGASATSAELKRVFSARDQTTRLICSLRYKNLQPIAPKCLSVSEFTEPDDQRPKCFPIRIAKPA